MVSAAIVGSGSALPPPMAQVELWEGFFRQHYADDRVAAQVWQTSGIGTRRGVVNPTVEDVSTWGTGRRMRRFLAEAVPLGKEALAQALEGAGIAAEDVGLLTVVSSTGYATPGLDVVLARDLGMSADVQRLHIGHMGCFAALPALGAASDFVTARRRPAVVLSVELTSLHLQPASATVGRGTASREDREQMIAHAIFSDAATAVVLRPEALPGLDVVDVVAHTDAATAEAMTWEVTDHGFRMGLSPRVPAMLGRHVRAVVQQLLDRHGVTVADVAGWAVHPAGDGSSRRWAALSTCPTSTCARRTASCATRATARVPRC